MIRLVVRMAMTTKRVTLTTAADRADLVVRDLTGRSRSGVRGLFDHGCVTRDGAALDAGDRLAAGATVVVTFDAARHYKEKPRLPVNRALAIVFEDPHLIVVDKPAGLLSVPTPRGETDTLFDAVCRHVNRGPRLRKQVTVVQRLDRDTSGLLVFAKNRVVGAKLQAQLKARKPEREYVAFVAGHLALAKATFRSYLRTAEGLHEESTADPSLGKEAVTHYEVVERLRQATQVRVHLETGRRNQIRAHFAEAGHPVLGDTHYEPQRAAHPAWTAKRLALHAAGLGFVHPMTGARLRFASPLPDCFARFLVDAAQR
ncbi:MAG: RluA family pseudouridine synthase [Deltaproteobacteria bacterium]|nr:RluA family pseudouridine synthase [Deltaproteobacteria bacterium]